MANFNGSPEQPSSLAKHGQQQVSTRPTGQLQWERTVPPWAGIPRWGAAWLDSRGARATAGTRGVVIGARPLFGSILSGIAVSVTDGWGSGTAESRSRAKTTPVAGFKDL